MLLPVAKILGYFHASAGAFFQLIHLRPDADWLWNRSRAASGQGQNKKSKQKKAFVHDDTFGILIVIGIS